MSSPMSRGRLLPRSVMLALRSSTRGCNTCMRLKARRWRVIVSAVAAARICERAAVERQVAMAANDREKIVEIVGDTTGEPADGFHLVCLAQTLFETFLLSPRLLHRRTHTIERRCYLGDFVTGGDFERIAEVALLQGANATNKILQGTSERARNQEHEDAAAEYAQHAHSQEHP